MSLPTWAIFYNKGEEVFKSFANCGWFCNSDSIIQVFKEIEYPTGEWDEVLLYNAYYTKKEIEAILDLHEKLKKFWKEKLG